MKSSFLLNVLLAIAWAALLGAFTGVNLIAGFIFGYITIWLMQYIMGATTYFGKVRQIFNITTLFIWELILANFRVAYSVIAPNTMKPAIVAIPLDIKSEVEITLLANMITLTPGTLSLDVSDDHKILYVHSMHVNDIEAFRKEIKDGFERVVQEVFE